MHLRVLLPLLAYVAVSAATADASADWPGWRGPKATGFAVGTMNTDWTAKPPKELWRIKLLSSGNAGPSANAGTVFLIDHEGKQAVVRAFAVATGAESWRFAFDDTDKENYGFDRATPLIDGEVVYALGRLGQLHALKAKTGAKVWTADLSQLGGRKPGWNHTASPVLDGKALVVLPGAKDGLLALIDKTTGKVVGKGGGDEQVSYASPVVATIAGVKQYVVFSATRIAGIDAVKGGVLWQHPWKTSYDVNAATPLVIGDEVFITSGYGHGCAMLDVTAADAKVRWENKNLQAHFSSPIHAEGSLYGNSDPSDLCCLDARTGEVKWKQGGFGKGGVVGLDGFLIAQDGDGGDAVLVRLDPAKYAEMGRIKAFSAKSKSKSKYWTAPIIANQRLLLRSQDELVCYDLK